MSKPDLPQVCTFRALRAVAAIFGLLTVLILIPSASAQTFDLQMNKFQPFAIAPSQTAASSVILSLPSGQTTSPGTVALTCAVIAVSPTSTTVVPECQMSPPSVTPPGGATATVITAFNGTAATPGAYTVTVTGTATDGTTQTGSQNITVLAVTGQFNISVSSVLSPASVSAGSGAQATISVNPINSYSGTVTLSCSSVIPLVLWPPTCSFTYPGGSATTPATSVSVSSGAPGFVTLMINTNGPATPPAASANLHRRFFYALWLPVPLALLGVGAIGGKRSRKACGMLIIFILCASVLLIPACSSNSYNTPTSASSSDVTPNNTYTITLLGTDSNGNISSNAGTSAATLSLTVTTATN